ncbi:MAG: SDR family oxidoreductase [Verrucomicrobiota bacterium]|nr:SDR family oxidoreductase [Verrucomicrobiota bacterium]
MNQQDTTILLTGFTGVIGKRLAYELANRGHRVLCPVRAKDAAQLAQRFDEVKNVLRDVTADYHSQAESRLIPFIGDMRKKYFGLNEEEMAKLGFKEIKAVWHLAAALDLTETNSAEVFETNVGGSLHLLDLMKEFGVQDIHYFSTFAVHGKKSGGLAKEIILAEPTEFRNSYEESKWQSEKNVWETAQSGKIRAAIYRPSIVVGDSLNGRYEQFNAFNHPFDMASRLRKRLAEKEGIDLAIKPLDFELRLPGEEQATLNIVPLDYVIEITMKLYDSGQWAGKIFHITNPTPPKLEEVLAVFKQTEPWQGLRWSSSVLNGDFANSYEKFAFKQLGFLIPYLMGEASFDQTEVRKILNGTQPEINNFKFMGAIAKRAMIKGWQESY